MILDPQGKIVHRSTDPSKGGHFYNTADKPRVPYADLRQGMSRHNKTGLLHGIEIPPKLAPIAGAIKQGQLAKAQAWLKKVPESGSYGTVRAELEKRLEELRGQKLAFFETLLADGKHWDAYKVGASYARCFPKAPDAAQIKSRLAALKEQPPVKKSLDARTSFRRYALGCYGPRRKVKDPAQAAAHFRRFASKHEGTEYGEAAGRVAN